MNLVFGAHCLSCVQSYNESLLDPGPSKRKGQILNRRIWCDAHYSNTGHYRFALTETKQTEINVAAVPRDPNQLTLADDPAYETFTL